MYREIFEKIKFGYNIDDDEVVKRLNISSEQYQQILNAKELPYELLIKIKDTFKVSLDYLGWGKLTEEDEKILNKPINISDRHKIVRLAIDQIYEKMKSQNLETYWNKIQIDCNTYIESDNIIDPVLFDPFNIFELNSIKLWDFFKENNLPIKKIKVSWKNKQNIVWNRLPSRVPKGFTNTFLNWSFFKENNYCLHTKEYDVIDIIGKKLNWIESFSKLMVNCDVNWNNLEIFFVKSGLVMTATVKNNQSELSETSINREWIDRCIKILNGQKIEKLENLPYSKGAVAYSHELTRLTTKFEASVWDYELIDKILKIGGIYLKEKIGSDGWNSYTTWEPDYVMTEFIKNLVEKKLNKNKNVVSFT